MKDNTEMAIVCDACGESAATARGEWQDFEYNDGRKSMMLRAYVDVISCASCGTQYTGPDAEERRHEAICGHLGRMTPAEIRDLRSKFNLTQAELARKLDGVSLASVKRWEGGDCIQGAASDTRLRALHQELASERGATRFTPRFVTKLSDSILESEALFELRPMRRLA